MTMRLPILAVLAATVAASPAGEAAPKKAAPQAAAPSEQPVAWQVKPDPMPWKMDGGFQTDKQIPLVGFNSVVFPTSPSPFVAVIAPGDKKEDPRLKMYDLRRMEQVGKSIKHDKVQHSFVRVSPWGDQFAVIDNKADQPTVLLWAVTGEQIVPSIIPHQGKEKIEACDFAGKDQIITCMEVDHKRTWRIWDVKTGKEVLSFDYQLEYAENWMAFSPGRRYLAMEETHTRRISCSSGICRRASWSAKSPCKTRRPRGGSAAIWPFRWTARSWPSSGGFTKTASWRRSCATISKRGRRSANCPWARRSSRRTPASWPADCARFSSCPTTAAGC